MLDWADRLRNLATLMVIAIHVAAPIAEGYTELNTSWWWLGNFWNSVSRAGVPLFVMLSGYLLLGKDYPTGDFLRRRFTRVLVPALFWMSVYSLYNHIANGHPATFTDFLVGLVQGPVHYHLWFIYLIIGLYLIYPILRPWVRQARDADFWYLFAVCALASWGLKIIYTFHHIGIGIYWEFFSNNLGYFALGYYLGTKTADGGRQTADGSTPQLAAWPLTIKQLRWLSVGLIVVGTATTMLGSYWTKSSLPADTHRYFWDYLTPNVGFAAVGWFLLARYSFGWRPLSDIEKAFSEASFGIYLAHVLVMDWWAQCGYWHSKWHPYKGVPVLIGLITLMVFMVVSVIRTLPGGKKIT